MESRSAMPFLGATVTPLAAIAIVVALLSGGRGEWTPGAGAVVQATDSTATDAGPAGPPPDSVRLVLEVSGRAQPTPEPPLTLESLDDQNRNSDTGRLIVRYLADLGCHTAAALMAPAPTDAKPDSEGVQAVTKAESGTARCRVEPVLVALTDYDNSNSRWQADRTLATMQSAVGAAGYTLERFHLPGAQAARTVATGGSGSEKGGTASKEPDAKRSPGVLLFRHIPGATAAGLRETVAAATPRGEAIEVLVLLLVPEMPTSGMERLPFLLASRLALQLRPAVGGTRHLDVIGPSYSGSSLSLLRAIEHVATLEGTAAGRLRARVISGSATGSTNCALLAGALPNGGQLEFQRTVHEDTTLLLALQRQLGAIRGEWARGRGVALLVESNTGWGASLAPNPERRAAASPEGAGASAPTGCGTSHDERARQAQSSSLTLYDEALQLGFPLHIADRYASRQRALPALPEYARFLAPVEMLRLDDSITPTDRLPTFTPFITDAARDLTLSSILGQLMRREIGAVGILATDVRDHLFLAREINRVAPDVVMFGTEPDILMLHPEYQPYVRGTLMASSYPIQSHVQALTHGDGQQHRRVQFTSMSQQGLYNAMLVVLDQPHLLVDYRAPEQGTHGGRDSGRQPRPEPDARPVPWVLAAGQREFLPLAVYPELVSDQDRTLIPGATIGSDTHLDYLFASGEERVMWAIPGGLAILLLVACVAATRRVLPTARWLSPPDLVERSDAVHRARTMRLPRPVTSADALPMTARRSERLALHAEHAMLWLSAVLSLSAFVTWHIHLWAGAIAYGSVLTWTARIAGLCTAAGAVVLLWLGAARLVVVASARVSPYSGWAKRLKVSIRASAPELIALVVLGTGAAFVVAMVLYVWPLANPRIPSVALFASSRAFDLTNLLSVAPMLTLLPLITLVWSVWSLRTLYYQRVSPTRAMPLVHALVSRDAEDRHLEYALAGTLGTTMQPAGAYLILPVTVVLLLLLLLAPRTASIEGTAFGRLMLIGTVLAALASTLELAQAAWLSNRVTRLLERVRIHPLAPDIEKLQEQPFDWRPALQPPQSPHRLLLRALRALGEEPRPDSPAIAQHERVPVLRTQAWHLALVVAGRRLSRAWSPAADLEQDERRLIALVVSLLLQALVTRVVRGFGVAFGMATLLMVAHLLTAFSGRSLALLVDLGILLVISIFAIRGLLALERDHVLSKLWHGTPGRLNLSSGLVWRAVVYAGLPLLTILSARFPEVGGQLITVVEPLRHLLPMP